MLNFKKACLYHIDLARSNGSKNAVKNLLQLYNTPSIKVDALSGLLLTSSQLIKLILRQIRNFIVAKILEYVITIDDVSNKDRSSRVLCHLLLMLAALSLV